MQRKWRKVNDTAVLDVLIADITLDAYGDDEQLSAFCQVFEDEVALPADGFVIGEPVAVVEIDYGGNERRGLTAKCRRADGSEHVVGAADVVFPEKSSGARYVAAIGNGSAWNLTLRGCQIYALSVDTKPRWTTSILADLSSSSPSRSRNVPSAAVYREGTG